MEEEVPDDDKEDVPLSLLLSLVPDDDDDDNVSEDDEDELLLLCLLLLLPFLLFCLSFFLPRSFCWSSSGSSLGSKNFGLDLGLSSCCVREGRGLYTGSFLHW